MLGDCLVRLKELAENSVDLICTDNPYGYSFMGKAWDIDVPSIEILEECFRVLKAGHFGFFFSAPRQDVAAKLITNLKDARFDIAFDSIEWVYLTGFPKAQNFAKGIDKRFFMEWLKTQWQWKCYESLDAQPKTQLDAKSELKKFTRDCKAVWAKLVYQKDLNPQSYQHPQRENRSYETNSNVFSGDRANDQIVEDDEICNCLLIDEVITPEAKAVEGMYAASPKPARELILVVQKPFPQKTNLDLAIETQAGGLYFDKCRIPADYQDALKKNAKGYCGNGGTGIYSWNNGEPVSCKDSEKPPISHNDQMKVLKKIVGGRLKNALTFGEAEMTGFKVRIPQTRGTAIQYQENVEHPEKAHGWQRDDYENYVDLDLRGRFPANIVVSDNRLDIGKGDDSDFSNKFSLDKWWWAFVDALPPHLQKTFPFLYVPKPTKAEKNKGLEGFIAKKVQGMRSNAGPALVGPNEQGRTMGKNIHPTCKSIALMSYLLSLGSREGDVILDPYLGSGTTLIACVILKRNGIGIELNPEYFAIAQARIKYQEQIMNETHSKPISILNQFLKCQDQGENKAPENTLGA
jgi:DNA modification methylase